MEHALEPFAALRRALPAEARRISLERCPQRASVALIFAPGQDEPGLHLAMIRRATDPRDPWSGQMGFPGGRAEAGDLDRWAVAIRETHEELGLDLSRARRLGALNELQAMSRGRALPLAISPLVFGLDTLQAFQANEEVAEALWIPLSALRDPSRAVRVPWTRRGQKLELPGLDFEGRIVWGLSLLMLRDLFERLDAIGE